MAKERIAILIHCPDRKGVIASVTTWCFSNGLNIIHCQQCAVPDGPGMGMMFFMRIEVEADSASLDKDAFEADFIAFAKSENLDCEIHFLIRKTRVSILVSRTSHCLYELLSRYEEGDLPGAEIVSVIANHPDLENVAAKFSIPFHLVEIGDEGKAEQEGRIMAQLREDGTELVILARYMQILTARFINEYKNRIINIHHGFLPAFQGANPYLQAYERGVKMIGASAHYATEDLDQGPIIEQDVIRVNHEADPALLRSMGKDVEKRTLLRAVAAHLERRIIVFKNRTIVFSKES